MNRFILTIFLISTVQGQIFTNISGNIDKSIPEDSVWFRTCPDYIDSCIFICDDAISNPCHPEDLYPIAINIGGNGETTEGSRYRIYFPWEYNDANADKFTVTASWPCLSPTAVYASGNYAYWDIYGNDECPGTVQGSIWYGDDCEDADGNIGSDNCQELVGRFCFVSGDTLNWPEEADQNISTDVCNDCWMSSPAWSYYNSEIYSDTLLFSEYCEYYDHCHHSAPDSILCGVGFMDGADTSFVSVIKERNILEWSLLGNYPNPFNPSTKISFMIEEASNISLKIYDVRGNYINQIVNEYKASGRYSIQWYGMNFHGEPVSAGVYIYSLTNGHNVQSKKMILLK